MISTEAFSSLNAYDLHLNLGFQDSMWRGGQNGQNESAGLSGPALKPCEMASAGKNSHRNAGDYYSYRYFADLRVLTVQCDYAMC